MDPARRSANHSELVGLFYLRFAVAPSLHRDACYDIHLREEKVTQISGDYREYGEISATLKRQREDRYLVLFDREVMSRQTTSGDGNKIHRTRNNCPPNNVFFYCHLPFKCSARHFAKHCPKYYILYRYRYGEKWRTNSKDSRDCKVS